MRRDFAPGIWPPFLFTLGSDRAWDSRAWIQIGQGPLASHVSWLLSDSFQHFRAHGGDWNLQCVCSYLQQPCVEVHLCTRLVSGFLNNMLRCDRGVAQFRTHWLCALQCIYVLYFSSSSSCASGLEPCVPISLRALGRWTAAPPQKGRWTQIVHHG